MKLTVFLFTLLTMPAVVFAASFTDDFDSYTPGSDLNSSPYWFASDSSGSFIIADEGGNNTAGTVWNGSKVAAYACTGSAVWLNGTIGCDVEFTGSQAMFALTARLSGSSYECYVGGIYAAAPPVGATILAYVDATGEYTILAQDYFSMNENTWYTLDFEVTGSDTVDLSLAVNGSVNSACHYTEHTLSPGISGVVAGYDTGSEPVFSMDNFHVVNTSQPLARVTFGGIKALFR
jgi:hypothetical protein